MFRPELRLMTRLGRRTFGDQDDQQTSATTALLLLVSSGAYAQGATSALMANGYQLKATDALASKVIGIGVYSTIATNGSSDATAPAVTTTPRR